MPLLFLEAVITHGPPEWMPDLWILATVTIVGGLVYVLKTYSGGTTNTAERDMHGRVIMMTGGTSGIGAATAYALAERGAQLVLLTRAGPSDPFLADFVGQMRERTNNELIYAEQVDLSSLYSIRKFATKWIDNRPPRRLDMIILCAATLTPPGMKRTETSEGIEETWMVNYLANFHLLGILSPALRAQPFDRDVRVIIPTCSAYISSLPLSQDLDQKRWTPSQAYARSKLALMVFAQAFQKHLDAYKRPDQLPMNAKVVLVDPGFSRTPGMRRWLTRGTITGLFFYVVTYFLPWLFLKSEEQGAQSILYAVLEGNLAVLPGGKFFKECKEVDFARLDVKNDEVAKQLWESSDKLIESTEKEQAKLRVLEKQTMAKKKVEKQDEEKAEEIGALVDTIKKGRAAAKAKAKKMGKKAT
jgi:NAD(P)-dependent dehydrogenase (short-subunit alcohol dehydrogenase family)